MARPLRYLPRPGTTFEITTRTLQGRFLLRPSAELNEIILGILGRALSLYPLLLHLVVVASNHIHMLITTDDVDLLADFMQFVNSNIAREVGRLHHWPEKLWGRRYRAIPILDDEVMLDRAVYLLSHGCKERLVLRPGDWPGVQCVDALCRGKELAGVWYSRTEEYNAKRAGVEWKSTDFATTYPVPLSPLPCLADLTEGQRRSRFRELVQDIESWTRKHVVKGGRRVLGAARVKAQMPHKRPKEIKSSPAPRCHCSDLEKYLAYRDGYRWFASEYRTASRRLRAGDLSVRFPPNCFPPPLAYTGRQTGPPAGPDPPG